MIRKNFVIYGLFMLITVLILSVFYTVYGVTKQAVINQVGERQLVLARQTAKGITMFIDDIINTLVLAETLEKSGVASHETAAVQLEEIVLDTLKEKAIEKIVRADAGGNVVCLYPDTGLVQDDEHEDMSLVRQCLEKCKSSGQPAIVMPEHIRSHVFPLFIGVPVYAGLDDREGGDQHSEFAGMLAVSVSGKTIFDLFVRPARYKKRGYAWVLDGEGTRILFHSTIPQLVGQDVLEASKGREHARLRAVTVKMLKGSEGTGSYRYMGVEKLVSYSPISIHGLNWSIGVCIPTAEVTEYLSRLDRTAWVSIACVLLSLIICGGLLIKLTKDRVRAEEKAALMEERAGHAAVVEAMEKYRKLFTNMKDGGYQLNKSGEVTAANQAFAEILGYNTPEEVLGVNLNKLSSNTQEWKSLNQELEDRGFVRRHPIRMRKKEGSEICVETTLSLIRDGKGTVVGVDGVCSDVTGRIKLEQEVRTKAERLAVLNEVITKINSSMDLDEILDEIIREIRKAIKVVDRISVVLVDWQSGDCRIYGVWPEHGSTLGKRVTIPMEGSYIGEVIKQRKLVIREWIPADKNKDYFEDKELLRAGIVNTIIIPLISENKVLGTLNLGSKQRGALTSEHTGILQAIAGELSVAVENIALFNEALEANRKSELLLNIGQEIATKLELDPLLKYIIEKAVKALDATSGIIALLDPDDMLVGRTIYGLPGHIKIEDIKMKFGEGVGGQVVSTGRPLRITDADRELTISDMVVESFQIKNFVVVPIKGEERVIGAIGVNDKKGERGFTEDDEKILVGVADQAAVAIERVSHFEEMRKRTDELKRANEELERLNTVKTNFLSLVSHELRTPLTTVQGYLAYIKSGKPGPLTNEQDRGLGIVERQVEYLNQLITDVLDITRIESGVFESKRVPVDMAQVTDNVATSMMPLLEGKDLKLVNEITGNIPLIEADPDQMGQVLINLIGNAIKFTPEGGEIKLSFINRGNSMEFHVKDTGMGIAPEHIDKIFDRFFQADTITVRRYRGSGLGLTITRDIIELHNGKIWVESELNKGTTFKFIIPKEFAE